MNVFIVLAHPESHSFNAAMAEAATEALAATGHSVVMSDLYRMGFNPVSDKQNFLSAKDPAYFKQQVEEAHASETNSFAPDLTTEMEKLEACDLLIWQFPLCWFGMPAILKGWVDRVFAFGRIYGGGQIYEKGRFRGKRALLSLTTGGPAEAYDKDGFNGDISGVLRPVHRGMLEFVGFEVLPPQIVWQPVRLSDTERDVVLRDWKTRLSKINEEPSFEVGRY
ncbi:MAG: NAD(P)H-dependent oxidoreductase [Rhodospirillales bacterium]|nr:NAD(P)H-dependent oxidoreductase [Rhodospirillales bacterium]